MRLCAGSPTRHTGIERCSSPPTQLLAAAAFALAFVLRFLDAGGIPERYEEMLWQSIAFVALGKALIFTLLGLHSKWWRYFLTRDFPALLRATALASAALVVVFTVVQPFDDNLPRSIVVFDFILTTGLLAGARIVTRLWIERPDEGGARAQDAQVADRRRRLRRADGGARAAAQPGARRARDRVRRRRPAQARHGPARPAGARNHEPDRRAAREAQAGRGRDRDPVGAGRAAREGRGRVPRAPDPGPHAADRVRAPARRRPAHAPAARGAGRGRPRAATR